MNIPKLSKSKSAISDFAYIALNIALAVILFVIVLAINSPLPAFLVVLLSKWRIFAVRPHFWFKNIQSNLVDILVGLSVVVFLYAASGAILLQIILATLYAAWLLFIKPRSKRSYVAFQAGAALFFGTNALFMVSTEWPLVVVVLAMWLIGYATARHVLGHYRESDKTFFAMIWGLIVAELGWLNFHWAFGYNLPGLSGIALSQTALVVLVLGFLANRAYNSYYENEGAIRMNDIMLPLIFSVGIVLVVMLFFNTLSTGPI